MRITNYKLLTKVFLALLCIGMLILATTQSGILPKINDLLQTFLTQIDSWGIWGYIAFILLYILTAILWISGAILTLGAGAVFGVPKGFILVSIASTLGGLLAFGISRYLGKKWLLNKIESNKKFKALESAVTADGWKIVALTRLSPLFPYVFLNYAFGLTQISAKDFLLASWLGMMPGTLLYVYLGHLGKISLNYTTGEVASLQWGVNILGFLATLGATFYIGRIAKDILNKNKNI